MAHELEIINGQASMFSVNEVPWHGLGKVIKEAPSIERVLELAGLDWTVSKQPLFLGSDFDGRKVKEMALVRDSDKTVLGYAGEKYKPLQNKEALDFFSPFQKSGEVSFETAGSLKGGQKIWIMAALNRNEMEIVKGDAVRKYLLLSNGHDGITGVRVGFSPIRVVCANTLAMAHNNNESKLIRIFHSSKVKENLDLIRDTVNLANAAFEATAEQYRRMATKTIHAGDIEKYVDKVFYNGSTAEAGREATVRKNLSLKIENLVETGYGTDIPGVRGTVWGLYNSTSEYLSYVRGRSKDNRLSSLWFGEGKNLNQKAFDTALQMAA